MLAFIGALISASIAFATFWTNYSDKLGKFLALREKSNELEKSAYLDLIIKYQSEKILMEIANFSGWERTTIGLKISASIYLVLINPFIAFINSYLSLATVFFIIIGSITYRVIRRHYTGFYGGTSPTPYTARIFEDRLNKKDSYTKVSIPFSAHRSNRGFSSNPKHKIGDAFDFIGILDESDKKRPVIEMYSFVTSGEGAEDDDYEIGAADYDYCGSFLMTYLDTYWLNNIHRGERITLERDGKSFTVIPYCKQSPYTSFATNDYMIINPVRIMDITNGKVTSVPENYFEVVKRFEDDTRIAANGKYDMRVETKKSDIPGECKEGKV